jgi:hypothetical protein
VGFLDQELKWYPRRARNSGALGLASAVLLGASIQWAHHWGPVADLLVAGWATATVGAIGLSIWSLNTSAAGRRLARAGLILGSLSIVALVVAGIAYAAGADPAGACGGG